jgi:PadR family transcriptional regulator, regulatory protein PadR
MTDASPYGELFENLRIELRSGCLILAALGQLRTEHYGYSLRQALAQAGLEIEENTLYPMLRRLEKQGLLESEWREENNRKKRFYRLSAEGKRILPELFREWDSIEQALKRIRQGNRKQ